MELRKIILYIASIFGIVDSFYLVDRHYNAGGVCSTNVDTFLGFRVDCGYIDQSKFSEIFLIPVALIGFFYYLTIFGILYFDGSIDNKLTHLQIHKELISHIDLIIIVSAFGFVYTLYLIYVQFVVLEIVCIYCLYSALTTTIIFGSSASSKFISN